MEQLNIAKVITKTSVVCIVSVTLSPCNLKGTLYISLFLIYLTVSNFVVQKYMNTFCFIRRNLEILMRITPRITLLRDIFAHW